MGEIVLKKPSPEYAEQIMAYRREFLETGDEMGGTGGLKKCQSADEWLAKIGQTGPDKAPSTQYIALRERDNRLVGMIDLRHTIDHPLLSLYGGHIGYSVRPDERRKGYAKEMLRLCLAEAKKLGLARVMVTCAVGNEGSEKTILANGGVYQCTVFAKEEDHDIKRYWIELL